MNRRKSQSAKVGRQILNRFSSDEEIDFILEALAFVASEGWKLMPQYIFNNETGEWFQLKEERGTFVLEVDWLEPEANQEGENKASGFPRQGK